jgi:tetratricopeptide (TPR) repeat protein
MATATDWLEIASRHYQAGDFFRSEECAWSALSEDPNHADALQLFGRIAHKKGEWLQAIDYLNRSLLCDRANAQTWRYLGDAYVCIGKLRTSVAHYEQALRLRPDLGEVWNSLGVAWQKLEQWGRAEECHRDAVRLLPASAQAHNDLASALRGQRKLIGARMALETARQLEPDNPLIAYNLGTTLHELGEVDKAVPHYRRALQLKEGYADASNNLGTALKELGLLEEAISQFRHTLNVELDHTVAYYNLSELAAVGRYEFTPEELRRVELIAASERHSVLDRSRCAFAMASVLNRQGHFDKAFGYYQLANDLRKHFAQENGTAFSAREHGALVERIMATYDAAYFERVRGWGRETNLPIFIIGMPRSGSTLVEQILASHPQVFGAGELCDVPRRSASVEVVAGLRDSQPLPNAHAARDVAADFLGHLTEIGKEASRVTVKTLENYLHLGVIATLFPRGRSAGARIIHCRRDPFDVCLSCYFQNFQNVSFTCSLEDIGAYYLSYERLMAHWARVLPLEIREVSYEDLIHDQEAVSRKLLSFCGLDWDQRCLDFCRTRRAVRTASSVQVRQPISARAMGRWRNYSSHLNSLFEILGYPSQEH